MEHGPVTARLALDSREADPLVIRISLRGYVPEAERAEALPLSKRARFWAALRTAGGVDPNSGDGLPDDEVARARLDLRRLESESAWRRARAQRIGRASAPRPRAARARTAARPRAPRRARRSCRRVGAARAGPDDPDVAPASRPAGERP